MTNTPWAHRCSNASQLDNIRLERKQKKWILRASNYSSSSAGGEGIDKYKDLVKNIQDIPNVYNITLKIQDPCRRPKRGPSNKLPESMIESSQVWSTSSLGHRCSHPASSTIRPKGRQYSYNTRWILSITAAAAALEIRRCILNLGYISKIFDVTKFVLHYKICIIGNWNHGQVWPTTLEHRCSTSRQLDNQTEVKARYILRDIRTTYSSSAWREIQI